MLGGIPMVLHNLINRIEHFELQCILLENDLREIRVFHRQLMKINEKILYHTLVKNIFESMALFLFFFAFMTYINGTSNPLIIDFSIQLGCLFGVLFYCTKSSYLKYRYNRLTEEKKQIETETMSRIRHIVRYNEDCDLNIPAKYWAPDIMRKLRLYLALSLAKTVPEALVMINNDTDDLIIEELEKEELDVSLQTV